MVRTAFILTLNVITLNVERSTFNLRPSTFNLLTFNLQPSTQPSTFNLPTFQPSTFQPSNLQPSTFPAFAVVHLRSLCAIGNPQFLEDILQMIFHRALLHHQSFGDLGVWHAFCEQAQHIALALSETREQTGMLHRRRRQYDRSQSSDSSRPC